MLHHHKKHWLFHATMWVCAFCVLGAFGFVSWKFQNENKWLVKEVNRLTAENGSVKGELSMCSKKKMGLEKSVEGIVEDQTKNVSSCDFLGNTCDSDSCIFSIENFGAVAGMAKLTGYFINHKRPSGYEENKIVDCPAFVVTNGPEPLVNDLLSWVEKGNTINRKNDKGQLILTINLDSLTSTDKQKISKSREGALVDINIVRNAGNDHGLPDCGSLVEVLRVQ